MNVPAHEIALILAAACVIIEMLLPSFLFLAFAIGLAPVALLQWLSGSMSLGRDVLVFAATALLALFVMRRFVRHRHDARRSGDDVNRY
jgi:membrane protein implicated in regulation of membrane protease activity